MKKLAFILSAGLLASYAQAQTAVNPAQAVVAPPVLAVLPSLCDTCGTVQSVAQEKRRGSGGAVGAVGGAVVGGLLGNQVGGGDGKKAATVVGAVGGAVVGNEIQKRLNRKTVWITSIQMKDGSVRKLEQDAQPAWSNGNTLRLDPSGWVKIN